MGYYAAINEAIAKCQSDIDTINTLLAKKDAVDRQILRIDELKRQQEVFAQELADLEQSEFVLEAFNKAKVAAMAESVNRKFKHTRFKVFDQQINGGIAECCEAMVNTNGSWVPFSDANQAGRLNAGVDCINTLSEFYQVSAPIFIDNRESVTDLIETQSQVINLVVSPAHESLTVLDHAIALAESSQLETA